MPVTRKRMISQQLKSRGIHHPEVLSAMKDVPREEFVGEKLIEFAYRDAPLPIEEGQTISQPYIVALMAQLLKLGKNDKVLDVGTGSGYAAAVMSRVVSEVYSIELHKLLAETAAERFERLGYQNIYVMHGNGFEGWSEHAPYDAINVAAASTNIPEALGEQLAEGGRMVLPVGPESRQQRLVRFIKNGKEMERENLGRVRFVPLIRKKEDPEEKKEITTGKKASEPQQTESADSPSDSESKQNIWLAAHTGRPAVGLESIPGMIETAADPVEDIDSVNLDPLLNRIGDSRVVLLGESTHGTSEFYDMRARITKDLIERKGFDFVSVEADWPDAAHIDSFVRSTDVEPVEEKAFSRFPVWMWRNEQVVEFVNWLKTYNDELEKAGQMIGFHGLDFYSMYSSIRAIIQYLGDIHPELAEIAKNRYGCLTPYENNPATYARAAMSGRYKKCEDDVVAMLRKLTGSRIQLLSGDGDRYFDALQNARLVRNAEKYYRSMYYSSKSSWNVRDTHMFETLESLLDYYGPESKAVVWAHNSHIGDASATEMGARGEHNLGQIARENPDIKTYHIGFGTDHGTVAAASEWSGKMHVKKISPSVSDSIEKIMHQTPIQDFILPIHKDGHKSLTGELEESRLQRAIGVIYRPETELQSHYFQASLSNQYDEFIWFDETEAVEPLQITSKEKGVPETFPFGV